MRPDSPAVYVCKRSRNRGMHCWRRTATGAQCTFCAIELTGEDAADVFRGAETPIGMLEPIVFGVTFDSGDAGPC